MTTILSLPTELHHLILTFAIHIQQSPSRSKTHCLQGKLHTIHPSPKSPTTHLSNQPIPSLLHVSHYTRSLFFSLYPALTFAYGTYIDFSIDTLYLAHCPTPPTISQDGCGYKDGFDVCKSLGRDVNLKGRVKQIAVNETFWNMSGLLTLERSMAVEAWNLVLRGGMKGLEELMVVFGDDGVVPGSGEWETVGWFGDLDGEVVEEERVRRCDDFLRGFLSVWGGTGEEGVGIRYVVLR